MQQNLGLATHAADEHPQSNAEKNHTHHIHVIVVFEIPYFLLAQLQLRPVL